MTSPLLSLLRPKYARDHCVLGVYDTRENVGKREKEAPIVGTIYCGVTDAKPYQTFFDNTIGGAAPQVLKSMQQWRRPSPD